MKILISAVFAVLLLQACFAPEVPPEALWRVRDLSLSVTPEGTRLAHVRRCEEDCDDDDDFELAAVDPTHEGEAVVSNPLYQGGRNSGDNPLFEGRNDRLLGGGGAGGLYWFAFTDETGMIRAVSSSSSNGSPVEPQVSVTSSSVSRQTPNTSFGTLVRSGLISVSSDGSLGVVGMSSMTGAPALTATRFSADGTESPVTLRAPSDATVAAVARSSRGSCIASASGSTTTVSLDGAAPVAAPVPGLPAAVWTDGQTCRVVLKDADEVAMLWDGSTLIPLPASSSSGCTALSFDSEGDLHLLHVSASSSVLYVQEGGEMVQWSVLSSRSSLSGEVPGCTLALEGSSLHAAWVEDDSSIVYTQWDLSTGSEVLKTKHDTAKNSVGNIR